MCIKCGSTNALKSNQAIREELDRISTYLDPAASVSCQNQKCECFRYRVDLHPKLYHKHNPKIIQKLLDIFRVHYNYCKTEERIRLDGQGKPLPKRTPAMKLGLAKGLIRIEDILYFNPDEDEADREVTRDAP